MEVQIDITGVTPLLMKNGAGVDPEHPMNKAKQPLVAKRTKKTQADTHEIERLDLLISLYTDGENVVYPTSNVVRCFKEAGKITKQGTQISRGLSLDGIEVRLEFNRNGHKNINDLIADPNFVDRRPVGMGTKRIMRVRPRFSPWSLTVAGELFDDVMDVDDLERIAHLAGRAIGLGDGRTMGFGRFTADVKAL